MFAKNRHQGNNNAFHTQWEFPQMDQVLRDKIQARNASWQNLRQGFFREQTSSDVVRERQKIFSKVCLVQVAENIDISLPIPVTSHRPYIGRVLVFAKNFIMKLAKPVIRVSLSRQMHLNSMNLILASAVMDLEERVHKLESKLK